MFGLDLSNRNLFLDVLAIIFGTASWVSINGLWVELPLLVNTAPESWQLASYLSIITQIANLGPISYAAAQLLLGHRLNRAYVIYGLLLLGVVASCFLALFWDVTGYIGGTEYSVVLFVLVFFLALVDCTSSVLFMPFMQVFRSIYLNSYLIGEGMSGFIPALVALAQGVGGNPYCDEITVQNDTVTAIVQQPVYPEPRFSVEVFFFTLMGLMIASFIAFALINILPQFEKEYAEESITGRMQSYTEQMYNQPDNISIKSDDSRGLNTSPTKSHEHAFEMTSGEKAVNSLNSSKSYADIRKKFMLLLGIHTFVCFWSNGALPSIQTYSCLPYGNTIYHLAVTLNAMANPTMAFAANLIPCRKIAYILTHTVIGCISTGFILTTSLYSPNMLWGEDVGGTFVVLAWIINGGIFTYVKISIYGWCRELSQRCYTEEASPSTLEQHHPVDTLAKRALFWCGAFTQIGSALGSLIFFFLVNKADIFDQYYVTC